MQPRLAEGLRLEPNQRAHLRFVQQFEHPFLNPELLQFQTLGCMALLVQPLAEGVHRADVGIDGNRSDAALPLTTTAASIVNTFEPGQEGTLAFGEPAFWLTFQLGAGSGKGARVATVTVTGLFDATKNVCRFNGQAIVQAK